jgi:plasmid maintenance system killer protein
MVIKFGTKLKCDLNDMHDLKKEYGAKMASNIKFVVSVLNDSSTLDKVPNVPPTRRHKLVGNLKGYWAIDLTQNQRMLIRSLSNEDDPSRIDEIIIVDIGDYH